jgi:predicted TPR repeat methyltransferase
MKATKILDVGCGKGFVGYYLMEIGFNEIHGVDCSRIMLEEAAKKYSYRSLFRGTFGLYDSVIDQK